METSREQKEHKISDIPLSNTSSHKAAMMVMHFNTDITDVTVERPGWSDDATGTADL